MPITDSTSAVVAKRPRIQVVKRDADVCDSTNSPIVVSPNTAMDGWPWRTALRTAEISDAGSPSVRTRIVCGERLSAGRNRSGSAVAFLGSARYFDSPTVPTIVSQGFVESGRPNLIRL